MSQICGGNNSQIFSISAPASLTFVDKNDNPKYEDREVFLKLAQGQVKLEEIFCKAAKTRPKPTFNWTIGLILVLLINFNFLLLKFNFTDGKNISKVADVNFTLHKMDVTGSTERTNLEPEPEFLDVKQMLELEVTGWLDGKTLSCAVNRLTEKEITGKEAISTNVTFLVQGKVFGSTPFSF